MLYQLYEAQRALMAPFADFAAATAKLYKHPLSPFTHIPGAQRLSAGFELMHRLGMDYGLRLPGQEIKPASGEAHKRRCLEALAIC